MMATNQTLAKLITQARSHRMGPSERRQQRISLMMGLKDKESSLTREQVVELLDEHEGHATSVAVKR